MGQTAEEAIQQFSTAIVQGLEPDHQPTEAVHPDPDVQYHVEVNMDLLNSESELGSLSIQGPVDLEVGLSGHTNHQISRLEHNTSRLGSIVDLALGPNRSDPIWRLRLLAASTIVVFAVVGVYVLPRYLEGVHATYRKVMLITSVGAPIVVAVISLFASFWLASDSQSNWVTGLSVTNISMLIGAALAVYLMLQGGTRN